MKKTDPGKNGKKNSNSILSGTFDFDPEEYLEKPLAKKKFRCDT